MRNKLLTGLLIAVLPMIVFADGLKPLMPETQSTKSDMAVLYFDASKRFDLNIMAEFVKDCGLYPDVVCVCAESTDTPDEEITNTFKGTPQADCVFRGETDKPLPRIEFVKNGMIEGSIERGGNFASKSGVYLAFLAGEYDQDELAERLDAADSAENYKRIVPRMNFVLMLARKGEVDSALKELGKIDADELDDKGKLLLGQTYLRLKSPDNAVGVLSQCSDPECGFYKGVALSLTGDNVKAIETFIGLKGRYSDEDKLNYYLKKLYEAEGDMEHANEIRLPENYNTDPE